MTCFVTQIAIFNRLQKSTTIFFCTLKLQGFIKSVKNFSVLITGAYHSPTHCSTFSFSHSPWLIMLAADLFNFYFFLLTTAMNNKLFFKLLAGLFLHFSWIIAVSNGDIQTGIALSGNVKCIVIHIQWWWWVSECKDDVKLAGWLHN